MEVLIVDFADMSSRIRIRTDLMNVCIRDEIKHPVSCDRIREFDSEVVDQDFSVNPVTIFDKIDECEFLG